MNNNPKRKKFSFSEKTKILEKTDGRCAHCGKKLNEQTMTVEHIYPISRGGEHDEYNLVALCDDCNENKSNFTYSIDDFFKYIKDEYKQLYKTNLIINRSENKSEKKKFLPFDSLVFNVIPESSKRILYQMAKRKSRKLNKEAVDRLSVKLELSRAYPGDAIKIYELISKRLDKTHFVELNEHMYRGEYSVLNDIYDHEVMVLRKGKEVHGAFIFKKLKIKDADFVQLRTIEEETALRVKYVMSLAVVSKFATEIFSDIMDSLYSNLLRKNAIPIYFNVLTEKSFEDYNRLIKMPFQLDGYDGEIQFPSLQLIREYERNDILNTYMSKKEGEFDENDLDKIVDYHLNMKENHIDIVDFPDELKEVCERLGIKTRLNDIEKIKKEKNNG